MGGKTKADVAQCNKVPLVYIVILNWNNWWDTIECLESVFRNDYLNYRVIVCDNRSGNDSMERIKAWANGKEFPGLTSQNEQIEKLVSPPVDKPIRFVTYGRSEAERGGASCDNYFPLIIIQTGSNLGFAGGYNVALRYILARKDFQYVWLLNNDTVIASDALTHLVQKMGDHIEAGICGSMLLYYYQPDRIQIAGGCTYNRWFGRPRELERGQRADTHIDEARVAARMFYVAGASMLVSRDFLADVGLLSEDYFLYGEEIDWAMRARGKYTLTFSAKSVVYHKVGSAIGSTSSVSLRKRHRAQYNFVKSRLKIAKKYFPLSQTTIYLDLVMTILVRILRGQWSRAVLLMRVLRKV